MNNLLNEFETYCQTPGIHSGKAISYSNAVRYLCDFLDVNNIDEDIVAKIKSVESYLSDKDSEFYKEILVFLKSRQQSSYLEKNFITASLKYFFDFYNSRNALGSLQVYEELVKNVTEDQYLPEELSSNSSITEGAKISILVNKYERDPKARIACIKHWGPVCAVCGFDFGAGYGEKFIGKIHVHHIVPIASIGREYQLSPKEDLIPLCPNCHYVAHLKGKKEVYSIDEMKKMIKKSYFSK